MSQKEGLFVVDFAIEETAPQAEEPQPRAESEGVGEQAACAPASRIKLWRHDRLSQHEAEEDAARRGLAFENAEHPPELAACGLAILHLDHLQPWGDAERVYQASLEAT